MDVRTLRDPIARAVLLIIGFGAVLGTSVFIMIGTHFRQIFDRWALTRHLSAASRVAAALCSSLRSMSIILTCSIAVHFLTIAAAWCCIKAIAAPVTFLQALFLMPPVLLISTIPISIAGWGVRESSMIAAFAFAGLAQSRQPCIVHPLWCDEFCRRRHRRDRVDRERLAGAIV